mmetsp:Transcript_138441/g.275979  ORF Transcript_138441/g.275979 Transcript_138441/m.275979 type:complete len:126 (-) Transcript_138441:899-1276(-)
MLHCPSVHHEGLPTEDGNGADSTLFGLDLPSLGGFGRKRNCSMCRCHVTFELPETARCAALASEVGPQTNRSTDCAPAAARLSAVSRSHCPTSWEPLCAPSGSSSLPEPPDSLSLMQFADESTFM